MNNEVEISTGKNSGLHFPPARIHRHLKERNYTNRVGKSGSVYLAGVMEYLTRYVLRESYFNMKLSKRKRIQAVDIRETFLCDENLQQTSFASVIVSLQQNK
jgi:histone H3/H4